MPTLPSYYITWKLDSKRLGEYLKWEIVWNSSLIIYVHYPESVALFHGFHSFLAFSGKTFSEAKWTNFNLNSQHISIFLAAQFWTTSMWRSLSGWLTLVRKPKYLVWSSSPGKAKVKVTYTKVSVHLLSAV